MYSEVCSLALKEWAVTVRALDLGLQILLLRKGGIREIDKHFRLMRNEFLLYPTFEHQQTELVKAGNRDIFTNDINTPPCSNTVTFTSWAKVEAIFNIEDIDTLASLHPFHIWTNNYAEKRLKWKPNHPLMVMMLRTYHLEVPQIAQYYDSYGGCKSWVELMDEIPLGRLTPTIPEQDFENAMDEIKRTLQDTEIILPTSTGIS